MHGGQAGCLNNGLGIIVHRTGSGPTIIYLEKRSTSFFAAKKLINTYRATTNKTINILKPMMNIVVGLFY
jgi:hypothetical protein